MVGPDPVDTFLIEAAELLVQLEETLLALEEAPDDRDLVDTAFRALHTIKGSGAMFGFDAVAGFTHHLENAFENVRRGRLVVTPPLINVTLRAKDHIRILIELPDAAAPGAGEAILADLSALEGGGGAATIVFDQPVHFDAPKSGPTRWRVKFKLAKDAMVRGTNPMLLLNELRDLGPCAITADMSGLPPLEEMNPEYCYTAWTVDVETSQPRAAIEDVFIFVIDDAEIEITELGAGEAVVAAPVADVVEMFADEPMIELLPTMPEASPVVADVVEPKVEALPEPAPAPQPAKAAAKPAAPAPRQQAAADTLRVPAERLDNLLDQVGELVIAQARLKRLVGASHDLEVRAVAEEIERLSGNLRDTTMGIRMLPIGTLFGRFRRLVRDLSLELGKDVALTTSGEETELDKTVIERLNDTLVHLIRNSIDHGIETIEGRKAAGKPQAGKLHLAAVHSGAQVLITIRDDGKGLDRDRIRQKAVDQGLIAADAQLTDAELFQYIFHPGFSTAAAITNVSGRGVGMDVVKKTIEALRGTIEISSTPGQGAEITLRLPLTLAIIDGLLVRVGGGHYVLPLGAVEECVELAAIERDRDRALRVLNIRGELVPYVKLHDIFDIPDPVDEYAKVVIASSGERRVGLVVDQLLGSHQTVIKSLSVLHSDVETFSGATILGDGSVALILDVPHLVAFAQDADDRAQARAQKMEPV